MRVILYGGPRDGSVVYVTLPAVRELLAYAKDERGRQWRPRYRRRQGELGHIVSLSQRELDECRHSVIALLEKALAGKRPFFYDAVDHHAPWPNGV